MKDEHTRHYRRTNNLQYVRQRHLRKTHAHKARTILVVSGRIKT